MDVDRLAPARREACRTWRTGHQTWRNLLFLHWEVDVAALRALLPLGLAVDTFEGRAYVGLVPFRMHDVRFGPVRLADFLETNLRTYVVAGGVPGVWFFSLDAESALAVRGGRGLYRLPYFRAEMAAEHAAASWDYRSRRSGASNAELHVRWSPDGAPLPEARPGTLEHFLTERYALYGSARSGGVYRVRVHHRPWPTSRARIDHLATTIPEVAGFAVGDPIDLVLASDAGVAVETFARERVTL